MYRRVDWWIILKLILDKTSSEVVDFIQLVIHKEDPVP
jgi:hypothetical protein